jgi:uncharacterized protein YqgC (DUF456 family)
MKTVALWALAMALIILGFMGTVAPGLPGIVLIYAGMLLAAWIGHFTHIGWPTLTLLGVLMLLGFVAELAASVLGARRVGASRLAIAGSVLGGFIGLPFGIVGLVLGPLLGAVSGEFMTQRKLEAAARVGVGTFVGLMVGTLAKLALAVTMLGVFVVSYLL